MVRHRKKLVSSSLYFLTGFFVTSPVFALPVSGRYTSIFSFLLILVFFDLIRSGIKRYPSSKIVKYFFLWTLFGVLSSFFGYFYFADNPIFQQASLKYLPKVLIYALFLYLFLSQRDIIKIIVFGKGVLWGAVINLIAAFLDAAIFYSLGYSFINQFFAGYIAAQNDMLLGLYTDGYFRSSGFNVDQACIGLCSAFITSYSFYIRKPYLIIIALLGSLGAVSIVGMASIVIICLFHINVTSIKTIIRSTIAFTIILLFFIVSDNQYVNMMSDGVRARIEMKQETADDTDNPRAMYWKMFVPAVINTPSAVVIGTGYFTASYAYYDAGLKRAKTPYDPEQTLFAYYFDIGLIGLTYMLLMYYEVYITLKKVRKRVNDSDVSIFISFIEGLMISCLGYHFTMGSQEMFMTIGAVVLSVIYYKKISISKEICVVSR